jgi:hypothetical protein
MRGLIMNARRRVDSMWALVVAGTLFSVAAGMASPLPALRVRIMAEAGLSESSDPAYKLYREGYHAILEENWKDARRVFAELQKRFPKSEYRTDAEYWSAYSWKQEDRNKARTAYEKFIREHPESAYFGDAIADLGMLEIEAALAHATLQSASIPSTGREIRIPFPEELQRLEQEQERLAQLQSNPMQRSITLVREGDTLRARIPPMQLRIQLVAPAAEDPNLQLRISALDAMLAGKHDGTTFNTLHDIALDPKQPMPIRHIALNSLTGFPEHDPATVFLTVADRDTNETIQRIAIELFAGSNRARDDRADRLITMFRRFEKASPRREGALSTTLYSLAAIGNDRATEFIARIARSGKDAALRNDAVYYLGNIGTDKARQELLKIITGK